MSLWDWAVAAYGRPGAQGACLALQDDHGQNVPFLLWAIWAQPSPDTLAEGAEFARRWDAEVVGPLRGVRRAMAPMPLREEVKGVELAAERVLLEALEGFAGPGEGEPLAALEAAALAWGSPAPGAALARLAAALA